MDSTSGQTLICRLGSSYCSMPLEAVVETMRPLPIEPMAGAPEFVLGLAIVRGGPVAVVDLSRLINGRPGSVSRFVLVKTAERRVALAVSEVVGVRPIARDQVSSLPPLLRDADSAIVSAIGTLDAELFMVLQASHIVPDGLLGHEKRLAS